MGEPKKFTMLLKYLVDFFLRDLPARMNPVRITNDKTESPMVVTGLVVILRLLHRRASAPNLARDGV